MKQYKCSWFLWVVFGLSVITFIRLPVYAQMREDWLVESLQEDRQEPEPLSQTEEEIEQETTSDEYHTPLAGEPYHTILAGQEIQVEPRNRRQVTALTIGASVFEPRIGNHHVIPFAALYFNHQWEQDQRRLRMIVSGLVNYLDFADGTWNDDGWEAIARWENFTIPFPTTEIVSGEEVTFSEIIWGHLLGGVGLGWRTRIAPYHCDNALSAQVYYELGHFHNQRSEGTGEQTILPPDTFIHQLHGVVRADGLERNLMELPHRGWAAGVDLRAGRRDHWSDHQFGPSVRFLREDTRDYLRLTAYLVTALGIPFLSERHRFLLSFHLGWSPSKNWDRFSALRVGGGPSPSESLDLSRHPFPGALFDQFLVEQYALVTMEYRLEILFFLYAHIRGTIAWGRVAGLSGMGQVIVENETAGIFSAGLTSGFFWDSAIYVEYAYDNGVIRPDDSGHGILITWSKEL